MNTPLASIPFIDGIARPVFLDVDGRQYAATVGTDAVLTDYPLEMRSVFRKEGK
jgi:hypothetical protein